MKNLKEEIKNFSFKRAIIEGIIGILLIFTAIYIGFKILFYAVIVFAFIVRIAAIVLVIAGFLYALFRLLKYLISK